MNDQKPVFVTGATGSIGFALVRRLSESGKPVRALVRNPDQAFHLHNLPNLELLKGDLCQPASLHGSMDGCFLVYHCAAKLPGSSRGGSYETNVLGTEAILKEAIRSGVPRLVYTSSIGVYGICQDEIITEETPWVDFRPPYFATKQAAERLVGQAFDRLPIVIARLGDVIGPDQTVWVTDQIQKLNRGMLRWPPDSQCGFINPVYIDNLIDALVLLGSHPAAPGQVFNVVDGAPILTGEYYRRLARMLGKNPSPLPPVVLKIASTYMKWIDLLKGLEPTYYPEGVDYLMRKGRIYPHKMQSLLGWSPLVSQDEAFDRIERWLRESGYLPSAS